ncbi:MAG: nucleotidyltransferase domain-containing protein [Saprospiraceae bacterium]|nr:nucleotidyltransferase domain-containing protein [Saprospiraceae bacterium]
MVNKEDILEFLKAQKADFQRELRITKLGLFGSFARNEQTENSDIDIIVEFEPQTSNLYEKKNHLREVIGKAFNKQVDICREKYMKPYFRNQILQSAIYV